MSKHVFISHAHKDAAAATAVVTALEQRGINCWIAPRNVPPGGSYAEAILTAIENSSCFVLIYSEHSNVSSHVLREVERALKFGVNIVPVRFDDSPPSKSLDYLLATVHWLAIPAESRERSIAMAAEQIAEWLTNFIKNPTAPLASRKATVQRELVTQLNRPAKHSGIAVAAVLSLAVAAGAYWYLPFFKKSDQPQRVSGAPKPTLIATPAPTISLGRKLSQPNRRIVTMARETSGYAGVPTSQMPLPNGPANRNGAMHSAFPDQAQGQPGQFALPPPPPGMPMQRPDNGNSNGAGGSMNGGYPPPPPPPPQGPGRRPMFGGPNGPGPGQPPGQGEPRP